MNKEKIESDFNSSEDKDLFRSNSVNENTDEEIETIEKSTNTLESFISYYDKLSFAILNYRIISIL